MAWGEPLGLDELMIVNPSPSNTDAYFLSEDGTLYQVQGLGQTEELQGNEQYFLGEDGNLYRVQGLGQTEDIHEFRQYFLGEDGVLYQVQEIDVGEVPDSLVKHQTCQCQKK
jgi:hypothetical protein